MRVNTGHVKNRCVEYRWLCLNRFSPLSAVQLALGQVYVSEMVVFRRCVSLHRSRFSIETLIAKSTVFIFTCL